MTNKIIGLSGLARSGKDTTAKMLIDEYGFVQYSFAWPIKDTFDNLHAWNMRHREGDLKETPTTVSFSAGFMFDILQDMFGDYFDERNVLAMDIVERWIEILKEKGALVTQGSFGMYTVTYSPRQAYQWFGTELMRENVSPTIWIDLAGRFADKNERVVIPDVRFNNEADFIHSRNGILVRIRRDGVQSVNTHISESGLDLSKVDIDLTNNGTLDDLKRSVCTLNDIFNSKLDNTNIVLSEK